jgi:spore germination protein GerM
VVADAGCAVRSVIMRVAALAVLLFLVLASVLTLQTMSRLPDAVVYFVQDEGRYFRLEAVGRRTAADTEEERARAALVELARGPSARERENGLSSTVPSGTVVNALRVEDEVLHVELSSEFEEGGGSSAMQGRLYQVLYTLSQPKGIREVRLSVAGRPVRVFGGEGIIVDWPWLRTEHPELPAW